MLLLPAERVALAQDAADLAHRADAAAPAPPLARSPLDPKAPEQIVGRFLRQVSDFVFRCPDDGKAHIADLTVSVSSRDGAEPHSGELRFLRGARQRFMLQCHVPDVAVVALGQGAYPWMSALSDTTFLGKAAPAQDRDPLRFAGRSELTRVRLAAGLLTSVALAPRAFDEWLQVRQEAAADGRCRLLLQSTHDRLKGAAEMLLAADGRTPESLIVRADGRTVRVALRQWRTNVAAPETTFAEPATPNVVNVAADDVHRCFGALFDFAVERLASPQIR